MATPRRHSARIVTRAVVIALLCVFARVGLVIAQVIEPIGPFVIDVRGSLARYGQNLDQALSHGLLPLQLPSLGRGLDVGGHVYPVRWRWLTFGVGVSLLTSAGERAAAESDPQPNAPGVRTRFTAISPQLSFNFGAREGWSYISGGLGVSRFTVTTDAQRDSEPQRRAKTINYGGGARWFDKRHLAFSVDLRFYAISPLPATDAAEPATPRMTLMVVNVGVSFK